MSSYRLTKVWKIQNSKVVLPPIYHIYALLVCKSAQEPHRRDFFKFAQVLLLHCSLQIYTELQFSWVFLKCHSSNLAWQLRNDVRRVTVQFKKHPLPGISAVIVLLLPETSSSSSDELVLESQVRSLSLVLLSCSRLYFLRAAASRFCLSSRILSLCFWLRWPFTLGTRPFCLSLDCRFFLAAIVEVSLSDLDLLDFLPTAAPDTAEGSPSAAASAWQGSFSSAEDNVSESAKCPLEEGESMQWLEESLS